MTKQIIAGVMIVLMMGCGLLPPPPRPPDDANPPPSQNVAGEAQPEQALAATPSASTDGSTLTSPVMGNDGQLPVTFTCDGQSLSPPLAWQGAPKGTVGYALAMHHVPGPGDTHWYWVVYNIPSTTLSVEAGATNFGTFGSNSVNEQQTYAPPCSKGPGEKLYTITVYALSAMPDLPDPSTVDRDTLLAAITDITLASASIDVTYERSQQEGAAPASVEENNQQVAQNGTECDSQGAFVPYADDVHISCDDTYLYVETETGQPDHEMMRGITAWILRVPIPFRYTAEHAWKIPLSPHWLEEHTAAHARGPIAMAVNGVPIYHFDKRPDVALDDSYVYDPKFDTAQQGELDHCGGHAGQGEDYHYHIAPVCLLDQHDLDQPIAYTLGGGEIFYGTGADDYFGEGQYNHINNLPAEPLDECNGLQLADGSYVYYTTHEPPTIGCYHEEVDWALQIEPRQMRDLGQFGRNATEIVSLTVSDEARTLLFKTDWGELNAVVYQPSAAGQDCWDFQFRTNINQPVAPETHCRVE